MLQAHLGHAPPVAQQAQGAGGVLFGSRRDRARVAREVLAQHGVHPLGLRAKGEMQDGVGPPWRESESGVGAIVMDDGMQVSDICQYRTVTAPCTTQHSF